MNLATSPANELVSLLTMAGNGNAESAVAQLSWEQVASLSPEQLKALHDANLLDDFAYGNDKPDFILNAITGTDIISAYELATGFNVKADIKNSPTGTTIKLLLDNDRGSWSNPDREASTLADYTLIATGVTDMNHHIDFSFINGIDDGDSSNNIIGTSVFDGGSLTKKFTIWNDSNNNNIIDTGETAERVFYTADGTASQQDSEANPGINYSILDPITQQAFVYFFGDIDYGPQNDIGRDDLDGHSLPYESDQPSTQSYINNFIATTYEFHVSSQSHAGTTADAGLERANTQSDGNLLTNSASGRALTFEQAAALVAANFSNDEPGSNPEVLDFLRDILDAPLSNRNSNDDISGLAGWQNNLPNGWASSYWTGTQTTPDWQYASPREQNKPGHIAINLQEGYALQLFDDQSTFGTLTIL